MTIFSPLPFPEMPDGSPRRCGVEIEFSGLSEVQVAAIIRDHLGGKIQTDGRFAATVTGTQIGKIRVELDLTVAHDYPSDWMETGLDLAKSVIPVEVITEPLRPGQLHLLNGLCDALRTAGGEGTGHSLLTGFGVHLNVEALDLDGPFTRRTILAFALLEPWLRTTLPPDNTRRVLPFVNSWPLALVDGLVVHPEAHLAEQRDLYASLVTSRNHGLDLLPLFKVYDPHGYARAYPATLKVAARPAFHFRLPDCRLNDPHWSLNEGWNMWRAVESLAAAPDLLHQLCAAWPRHRAQIFGGNRKWARTVSELLIPSARAAS